MTHDAALLPFPEELIDALGEYGCARSDGVSEPVRLHRWQIVVDRIKQHARANVTAALASAQAREDELRAEVERLTGVVRGMANETADTRHRAERLEVALREYGMHDGGCLSEDIHGNQPCSCGLDTALSTNAATQPGETT